MNYEFNFPNMIGFQKVKSDLKSASFHHEQKNVKTALVSNTDFCN